MAIFLATWFQEADVASTQHWIMIFTGILAFSILLVAIVGSVVLLGVLKAVKGVTAVVSDLRDKAHPVIQEVAVISRHTREVLEDAKPKIKTITEHLAQTSATLSETAAVAKSTAQKVEATVTDANARTQRQVARVDGMVSAALNTTVEIAEAVNHGIRVPAQKIAQAAGQARFVAEGLIDRIRAMAANIPGVASRTPTRSTPRTTQPGTSGYRSPATGSTTYGATSESPSAAGGRSYAAAPKES
jgi:methyl-accepting chemotaxis protein